MTSLVLGKKANLIWTEIHSFYNATMQVQLFLWPLEVAFSSNIIIDRFGIREQKHHKVVFVNRTVS